MTAAFKPELVAPILDGRKIHTFREGQRWRLGLDVQFVINNRTPRRAEFRERTPLVSWQPAELSAEGLAIDGRILDPLELDLFARQDGFANSTQLLAFFAKRQLPLRGQVLHWTDFSYLHPQVPAALHRVIPYLVKLAEAAPASNDPESGAEQWRWILMATGVRLLKNKYRCTPANMVYLLGVRGAVFAALPSVKPYLAGLQSRLTYLWGTTRLLGGKLEQLADGGRLADPEVRAGHPSNGED